MIVLLMILFSSFAMSQSMSGELNFTGKKLKAWNKYQREYCSDTVFKYKCKKKLNESIYEKKQFENNFWKWISDSKTQKNNNCYNYAVDLKTNTFAQPGRMSGKKYETFNCGDKAGDFGVVRTAINDGLTKVNHPRECRSYEKVAYLIVSPDRDYHWLSLKDNGIWMHKNAWLEPTMLDSRGHIIRDVEKAYINTDSRGHYTDRCGYFCIDPSRVNIK